MLCPMSTAATFPIIKSQMLHKCPSKHGQSTKIWYEPNTMDSIFLWFWVKSVQTESKLETVRTGQERVSHLAYTEFLLETIKFWRHWIIQHCKYEYGRWTAHSKMPRKTNMHISLYFLFYIAQASLKCTIHCLCFSSAGITGMYHHKAFHSPTR